MLIQCSECGGSVSDKAASCPHCGCPIAPAETPAPAPSGDGKTEYLCCPQCKSRELQPEKRGFSTGKALMGAFVFGPYGILAGNSGARDEYLVCLKCGNRFKVGTAFIEKIGEQADDLETRVADMIRAGKSGDAAILYQKETNARMGDILPYLQKVAAKYGLQIRK